MCTGVQVNASPSLTASSQEDYRLKFRVLSHMLDILDVEGRRHGGESHVGGFDLLVNKVSLRSYVYKVKTQ